MKSIKDKLKALRKRMKRENIAAYIIPTNGPHMSEYVTDHWMHREWISGFIGSAGTVVITKKKAGLWTDARYFLQAEEQLDGSGIDLFKMGQSDVPNMMSWLRSELSAGDRVGAAALTTMEAQRQSYRQGLALAKIEFVTVNDLVGDIWGDRQPMKKDKVFEHALEYAGRTRTEKLSALRTKMKARRADALLITALDEIAWSLNLRGSDVLFNPVFYAYLWLGKKSCYLYIDPEKVDEKLRERLNEDGIEIMPYDTIYKKIKKLSKRKRVAVDKNVVNARLFGRLKAKSIISVNSPAKHLKASKNPTEIRHLKQVMVKDGVALVRAFRWLEQELGKRSVSEYEFGLKLADFRRKQSGYFGESFSPIVGYQSNGAIMHYRADEKLCKNIKNEGILLVDSGGQYVDGTTDITRTFALTPPGDEQKKQYTLVLKGHIALARAHFPQGTTGLQLDVLARQFLWNNDLDFAHGTGHGVGFFMNVHEPPQGFAPKFNERGQTPHRAGMYSSNEPGYYEEGSHGIRLENLVICVRAGQAKKSNFLRFDTITLYPFDLNFIDRSIMTRAEVAWLNSYHRKVEKKLGAQLNEEEAKWLAEQCKPLR